MSPSESASLSEPHIAALLEPYVRGELLPPGIYGALSRYLALLLRWNARTNLTAVRGPEEMVRRHFGESLFLASELGRRLPPEATLLDFGSGAGFPGLPIQLLLPQSRITLAESQGKKAAFLREAVRTLGLRTEVWAGRVEAMPPERRFDAVALRAVDRMPVALGIARPRVANSGWLVTISGDEEATGSDTNEGTGDTTGKDTSVHSAVRERVPVPGRSRSWISFDRVSPVSAVPGAAAPDENR